MPVVLAAGAGKAGAVMLRWSAIKHLRQIRYAIIDSDASELERSEIEQKIHLKRSLPGHANMDVLHMADLKALSKILGGVDICVVVAGIGGIAGSVGAITMIEAARRMGIPCLTIALIPAHGEDETKVSRALNSLDQIVDMSDVTFLAPIDPGILGSLQDDENALKAQDLYEYVDRVLQIGCAPLPTNLVARAALTRAAERGHLGLFRRYLFRPSEESAMVAQLWSHLTSDPNIQDVQLTRASDVTIIVQSYRQPSAAIVGQITYSLSKAFPPEIQLDLITRRNQDCGDALGLEFVSFCPAPLNLMARVSRTLQLQPWNPLMPWLDRTIPSPIAGREVGLTGGQIVVAGAATRVPVDRQRKSMFIGIRSLFRPSTGPSGFAQGSYLARLDELLTHIEASGAQLSNVTKILWAAFRANGWRLPPPKTAPLASISGAWRNRRGSRLWNWRSVAIIGLLVAIPFATSSLILWNMQSIVRASLAMNDTPIDIGEELVDADKFRILAASKFTPATYGRYETMGLAAALPSVQTSHLDLWAVQQGYLQLDRFNDAKPPFAFVEVGNAMTTGQIRLVADYLKAVSSSPAQAMFALGIFPELERFAKLADVSKDQAASDMFAVYAAAGAGGDLDTILGIAGCRTVRAAVDRHFAWKREAPTDIALSDRHYLMALAFRDTAACRRDPSKIFDAGRSFSDFTKIAYVRQENKGATRSSAVTYDVVIPRGLAKEPIIDGDLGVYLSGLRAFYFLDFSRAREKFDRLSRSSDRDTATLGSFLLARIIFWAHDFDSGSYRPDLFPPWRHLVEDADYSVTDQELGHQVNEAAKDLIDEGELENCSQASKSDTCRWAVRKQRADEVFSPFPPSDAELIQAALKRVERNPIIDPELVRLYLGATTIEGDDGPEDTNNSLEEEL
ncbi:hypothetical protein U5A82_02975 [Sphingobium sp. CR2-8]|uniref:hypothetical protein n=1 Tax=Sphingobium sp. CR2-8 TaxID=1306534 RepID=UPI002DB9C539|nr:hypothetical protein [Sphingobium sp. CR2-8]MEC3909471.1 hypothetical protein [Sphingobium sp. CR2-8]